MTTIDREKLRAAIERLVGECGYCNHPPVDNIDFDIIAVCDAASRLLEEMPEHKPSGWDAYEDG